MRTDPPRSGPERHQLSAGLAQRVPPSSPTLGGLLDHLALVEDRWFRVRFLGQLEPRGDVDRDADPDREFRTAADLDPDDLRDRYRAACDRSRAVVRGCPDLDRPSAAVSDDGEHWDLRSILLHRIGETARHAGHADLPREAVDAKVGE